MRVRSTCLIFLSLISLISCSFNSTFFAVENQDLNATIADLDYEEINFESDDAYKVRGLRFKPDQRPLGTIFFLPGSGDNMASWSSYAKHLVKGGFQVYMIEYRGFGKSTGKATHKNVLKDAENALIQIAKNDLEKGTKVILLGQSYGGQIAINLTSRHKDKISALITEGTFTSFNNEVVYSVPLVLKPFLAVLTKSQYKSKNLIKDIQGIPVLIIHSKDDTVVPFSMGQELFSNANSPKYFWEIQGEHVHGLEEYSEEYLESIRMLTQ